MLERDKVGIPRAREWHSPIGLIKYLPAPASGLYLYTWIWKGVDSHMSGTAKTFECEKWPYDNNNKELELHKGLKKALRNTVK